MIQLIFDLEESEDVSQASGRQSSSMQGNQSGGSSGCNFTNIASGMGGPVWDSTGSYNLHDIVEWPADSGHFWQTTTAGPTDEPSSTASGLAHVHAKRSHHRAELCGIQHLLTMPGRF